MFHFADISIDFHPIKGIEFTTTVTVFWWGLVQHIKAVIFEDIKFFYIVNPNNGLASWRLHTFYSLSIVQETIDCSTLYAFDA